MIVVSGTVLAEHWVHTTTQEPTMNSPRTKPLDAAVAVLGAGLVLGVLMRVVENARPLAALLGF